MNIDDRRVYVTREKAHRLRSCAGAYAEESTWGEAKADGKEPCRVCAKYIIMREELRG